MKITDDIKIEKIMNRGISVICGKGIFNTTKYILMMHNHYDLDISGMKLLTFKNVSMYVKYDREITESRRDSKGLYYCQGAYKIGHIIKDNKVYSMKINSFMVPLLQHYTLNKNRYYGVTDKMPGEYYIIIGEGYGNYIVDGKMIFNDFLYNCDMFDKNGYAKIAERENEYYIVDAGFKKISNVSYNTIMPTEYNYRFSYISRNSKGKNKIGSEYWIVANKVKDSDYKVEYNYMLSNGKLLCKKWYAYCHPFYLGMAEICKEREKTNGYIQIRDASYNFVDSKGHEVFGRDFCGISYIKSDVCNYYLVYRRDRKKRKVCNIVTRDDGKFLFNDFWLVEKPKDFRNNVCIIQRANDNRYTFFSKYLGMPTEEWFDTCEWAYKNCAILKRPDGKMNVGLIKGYKLSYMSDKWVEEVEYLGKAGQFKFIDGDDVKVMDHEGRLYRWPDLKLLKW